MVIVPESAFLQQQEGTISHRHNLRSLYDFSPDERVLAKDVHIPLGEKYQAF
jgi:hypothetical protein